MAPSGMGEVDYEQNSRRGCMKEPKITKIQDDDFHWYWIPDCILSAFKLDLKAITGKMYLDNPEAFDEFNEKYGQYRTGGAPDLAPDMFENKEISFENLVLSQEDFETIEDLAASNYGPDQVAKYLSLDKTDFREEWNNLKSKIRHHYDKGQLTAEFEINQKLLDNARSGNITAAQIFEKNRDRVQTENLKNQIYFA